LSAGTRGQAPEEEGVRSLLGLREILAKKKVPDTFLFSGTFFFVIHSTRNTHSEGLATVCQKCYNNE
jgi:hypothetical protein